MKRTEFDWIVEEALKKHKTSKLEVECCQLSTLPGFELDWRPEEFVSGVRSSDRELLSELVTLSDQTKATSVRFSGRGVSITRNDFMRWDSDEKSIHHIRRTFKQCRTVKTSLNSQKRWRSLQLFMSMFIERYLNMNDTEGEGILGGYLEVYNALYKVKKEFQTRQIRICRDSAGKFLFEIELDEPEDPYYPMLIDGSMKQLLFLWSKLDALDSEEADFEERVSQKPQKARLKRNSRK